MKNVYDKWMAMPEAYRTQFNAEMIKEVTPQANAMYALPFTGYATFLYRNLTVLKAAGIDEIAGHAVGAPAQVFKRVIVGNNAAPAVSPEFDWLCHFYLL